MRVSCRVSWIVFSEPVACLLVSPGSHSPSNIHLEEQTLPKRLEISCRNYTVSWSWSKDKDHDWGIRRSVLGTVHHFEPLPRAKIWNRPRPPSEPISERVLFSLICGNKVRPFPGIRLWPYSCSLGHVCTLAPFERFAGARGTSGREPRPRILQASPRRACDVTASQPTLPKPGSTARFHFLLGSWLLLSGIVGSLPESWVLRRDRRFFAGTVGSYQGIASAMPQTRKILTPL